MDISIITAFDQNQLIGANNQLPWHIPEDLLYFKKTTLHMPIIMGRKTYESIGRPLPKRENIVISSTLSQAGVTILKTPDDVFKLPFKHVFIIGGKTLYDYFLPKSTHLYITHIDASFSGDTYFPNIAWKQWKLIHETPFQSKAAPGRFCIYERATSD